jgi:hypothetical protein
MLAASDLPCLPILARLLALEHQRGVEPRWEVDRAVVETRMASFSWLSRGVHVTLTAARRHRGIGI